MKLMLRKILSPVASIALTATLAAAAMGTVFGSPNAHAQPAQTAPQPAPNPAGEGAPQGSTTPPPPVQQPDKGTAEAPEAPQPDPAKNAPAPADGAPAAPAPTAPATAPAPAPAAKAWYDKLTDRPISEEGTFWMPKSVNIVADSSDTMFYAVLGLSIFFFVGITFTVLYFTWRYRHRPGHKAEPSAAHNDAMEITWTVIPTLIVVFLFYYGWRSYINVVTPPQQAVEVNVQAWRWAWSFTHANGVEDSDLHVPVNTPVRLVMTSRDVLHSFYAPVLRTKQDIIPRRYTYVWFKATKPGTYRLACAEYCGTNHSQMGMTAEGRRSVIVVHEAGGYEKYLADKAASSTALEPDKLGAQLFEKKGCVACHTTDGTPRVGPSLKGIFGTDAKMADGSTVKIDENYVRESLLYPQAKARPGFPPSMPSFEGQLKEKEIEGLIAFIKSLK